MRRKHGRRGVVEALLGLVIKARRRYGGYIVHLGIVLMFFGFAGNAYKIERKVGVYPGDEVELGPSYVVIYEGAHATQDWQKDMLTAEFTAYDDDPVRRGRRAEAGPRAEGEPAQGADLLGSEIGTLTPGKWWYYQLPEQPTTEVSRLMLPAGDIYASIADVDMTTGWARLNLYYNPLVNWVWIGFSVLLIGGVICLGTQKGDAEGAAR